jgi:hypothetical protein
MSDTYQSKKMSRENEAYVQRVLHGTFGQVAL